jgi:hypothetical protein
VTGVDIDAKLVAQANKLLAIRTSRTRPPIKGSERAVDWFPMSAVLKYGYIEPNGESSRGPKAASADSPWPRVSFSTADWATDQDFSAPYDVILALSVSRTFSDCWPDLTRPRSLSGYIWSTWTQVLRRSFKNAHRHYHLVAISLSSCKPGTRMRKLSAQVRHHTTVRTSNNCDTDRKARSILS